MHRLKFLFENKENFYLSCVLIGLTWLSYAWLHSQLVEKEFLQAEERILLKQFEKKQREAAQLQAYSEQLKQVKTYFNEMIKQLSTKNNLSGLLEKLSKIGIQSGLTFELFAPEAEVMQDFYVVLPIKIQITGSYNQLMSFLRHLALMKPMVTLHEWSIERDRRNKQNFLSDRLVIKMIANIYWYHAL